MESDIKIMLPRAWEPALLRAQAEAGERTMTAFVKSLVQADLVRAGYLTAGGAVAAPGGVSEPVAATTA